VLGLALAACPGQEGSNVDVPPPDPDPVKVGHWTYYGTAQGLSGDIQDVSADEGGNVYVAGGDALYVKLREDERFLRFDSSNAGLTVNCNDPAEIDLPEPTKPFYQCRILAVAGASPGKAIIGFEGFGHEAYASGWDWVLETGGADVVQLDPDAGTLSRTRHVLIASPPHVICSVGDARTGCDPDDWAWTSGRRLVHKVRRIVVNHDTASALYGDVWLGGEHGTFSALLNDAAARGYVDRTEGWAGFEDAKDVWEHLHPAVFWEAHPDSWINGEGWALSIDPRNGRPWGSNEYRTAYVAGYGPNLAWDQWGLGPWDATTSTELIDVWPDGDSPFDWEAFDAVRSMSHCPDGTLWIGSLAHGLARIATDGTISYRDVPGGANGISAVACDPSDASVWIGLVHGGVTRLRDGAFEPVDATGLPAFASHPVQSIQIDRWSSPRIVYFAFLATDAGAGGVASYEGP
jgi:hypothetical protein